MMQKINTVLLDEIDWRILEELQRDGRVSHVTLSKRVSLSRPAVAERVKRLEEVGVISHYCAVVSLEHAGYPIVAVVRLSAAGNVFASFTKVVKSMPNVLECHRGTGGDCFILKVAATSLKNLETLIDNFTRFGQVTTSIILSTVVTSRAIVPPSSVH